jgi:glycosyltransferase involved in cell wall biosynthesis
MSIAFSPLGSDDQAAPVALRREEMRRESRPFRICYISETVDAGVGRHLLDVITAMSERGHAIHLIYSPTRVDPAFLRRIEAVPATCCVAIPMPRDVGFGDFRAFMAIRGYITSHGPFDIIHGHSAKGGGYARLLKLCRFGPIFYTPHAFVTLSSVISRPAWLTYWTIEAMLAPLTDCIVSISQIEHAHARQWARPERIGKIIIGAEPAEAGSSREAVRAAWGVLPGEVVVGYAARMVDQKAPDRAIGTALKLLPELSNLRFVMVGDGPNRQPLNALVETAGLSDRVRWIGYEESRSHMKGFDIFILSSRYEGFARTLVEAMQEGLPIVSTPVGGVRETVEPGVNGFIVPHDQVDEMVDAVRQLATDPALRRSMGEASRQRSGYFSISRMVDGIENLYRDWLHPSLGPVQLAAATASPEQGNLFC